MEATAKLIEALSHLVGALAWPAVVAILAYLFRPVVRSFLNDLSEGSLKGFGVEASAKKAVVASIVAAKAEKPTTNDSETELSPEESGVALEQSARLVTSSAIKSSSRKVILWVDDKPEGNVNERRALRAIGFKISKALSTDSALTFLRDGNKPDLIISDLTRPEGPQAGFDLLQKSKELLPGVPFIIYSGVYRSSLRQEAFTYGAFEYTSDPAKLIEMVLKASKTPSVFD